MAGPSVMALGPFVFQAHGFSFTDRKRSQKTGWAEIQVAGGMNPHQWTGGQGAGETISGVLFPDEFGGQAALAGLYAASQSGQVLPLVTLGGGSQNIHSMWFIEDISDDHAFVDRFGRPHRNAYSIGLKAYFGGSFQPVSILSVLF